MTISESRAAIAGALMGIPGLTVYDVWPNNIVLPAALVHLAEGSYMHTFQGGLTLRWGIFLLVSGQNSPGGGMRLLDEYLEPGGITSMDVVLRSVSVGLASFENPGEYDINGKKYYGVHLTTGEVYL